MLAPEFLDGIIVALIAGFVAALELVGRHPEHAALVVRTAPGRKYLVVNIVAGALAYLLALALEVKFREPHRVYLILSCGFTATAVLRAAPVTRADIAGPARVLQKLQAAYTKELLDAANIRAADSANQHIMGFDWETDGEALGTMCLVISNRNTAAENRAMAKRLADIAATDLGDHRMFSFAVALRSSFGDNVLGAAATRVRSVKEESALQQEATPPTES